MLIIGNINSKGTTSKTSNFLYRRSKSVGAFFDRMTYRPYKGAHRGIWYKMPWNKGKF